MLQSGPRASDIDEALLNSAAQQGAKGSIGYQGNRAISLCETPLAANVLIVIRASRSSLLIPASGFQCR